MTLLLLIGGERRCSHYHQEDVNSLLRGEGGVQAQVGDWTWFINYVYFTKSPLIQECANQTCHSKKKAINACKYQEINCSVGVELTVASTSAMLIVLPLKKMNG